MQLMIRLAALVPLVTVSTAGAVSPPERLVLHTNQGEFVWHTNQESRWFHIVFEAPVVPLPLSTSTDPFSIDVGDPWAHGNSPRLRRMKTPPVNDIPAPATAAVLGVAFLGMRARRQRSRVN